MNKKHSFPGILVRYKSSSGNCFHRKNCTCFYPGKDNAEEKEQSIIKNASSSEESEQGIRSKEDIDGDKKEEVKEPHEIYLDDELHVNLWEIGNDNSSPFMDIGVMIHDHKVVDEVVIDLPWEVDRKDIVDLGVKLNSEKSVAAIFNEVVHYDSLAEGNFTNISFRRNEKDKKPFCLFRLNPKSFEVEPITLGDDTVCSRVLIKLPKYNANAPIKAQRKSAYIRFRIKKIPTAVYTDRFKQIDKALISSIIDTRIIDFRINVLRGVPEELMHSNDNLTFPSKLKIIHCFLTTIRDEECVSVSKYYNGYRSLVDEDIWNEYIKFDNSTIIKNEKTINNHLGYQWTAKADKEEFIKDLIVLGRFSKKTSNIWSIFRFVVVVILLGAMGSGIWETVGIFFSWPIKNFYGNPEQYKGAINIIILMLTAAAVYLIIRNHRKKEK
ncbi:hypothetical protein [Erwinia sp. ErVv1]|uniref:hypothetical protein n=1 Tax=Erwinia sp. ErVv1 TaxID=1603299 RepID=UPI000831D198|nr:hypothetical protein [Erwinia sp. ErVv1]